jgi:hypothetical protein
MHGDHRGDRVHRGTLPLGVLGTGHPLASLLSKLDVHRNHNSHMEEKQMGSFIGVGAAGLWNYMTLCVNTFLKNGLNQASSLVHTGHLPRPDLFISVPGWLGNLAVILGCLWVYASLPNKQWGDAPKFAAAVAGTAGFFALIIALFQPRYLALFPGLLHPHLHL